MTLAEQMLPILNDGAMPPFALHEALKAEVFVDRVVVAANLDLIYNCPAGRFEPRKDS